jgi:hypothetical protein
MSFLVSEDLNLILYPNAFPHKAGRINALKEEIIKNTSIDISQWKILASVNHLTKDNSIGNISLRPIEEKKCICGKNVTYYCIVGNEINGDILIIGFDCMKRHFSESVIFQNFKLSRKLVRKCKNCNQKYLINEMVGRCCNKCQNFRTSNYFGCISCLSYEKGMMGALQCINCQIAKRPYYQIKKFPKNSLADVLEENLEMIYIESGYELVTSYKLNNELISLLEPEEKCVQCGNAINMQEQLRTVPIDQLQKCIRCVYPSHGRCVSCNRFLSKINPGKDKCLTCFKKFMRNCTKRQCTTCGHFDIPDIPGNERKTQCFSCWKKSMK